MKVHPVNITFFHDKATSSKIHELLCADHYTLVRC